MNQSHHNEVEAFCTQLFHNILNPLTVISLEMDNQQRKGPVLQGQMDTIIHHLTHLEYFVSLICENVKSQLFVKKFSVNDEVEQALEIVSYKAKRANVQLLSLLLHEVVLHADKLKFHQLLLEVFLFFLDAAGIPEIPSYEITEKKIEVTLEKKKKDFFLSFAVYGIPFDDEKKKIIEQKFKTEFNANSFTRNGKEKNELVIKFKGI